MIKKRIFRSSCVWGLTLLAVLGLFVPAVWAQSPPIDVDAIPENFLDEQLDLSDLTQPADLGGESSVVTVSAMFTAPSGDRPAMLHVTAKMEPGWYIYSITQAPGGPIRTKINLRLPLPPGVRQAGPFTAVPPPHEKKEPAFNNLLVQTHEDSVTWHAPLSIDPSVNLATLVIPGTVYAQPCSTACLMPQDFPFTAALGEASSGQFEVAANEEIHGRSVLFAVAMGFLGGLILNLMPCVLPVIGLKILSFVEQSGHSRARALQLNIWYSLGLMFVFMVLASLAVFAGYGWGTLFQFAGFSIALAAVVFVMALSFLGIWEVPIPGFVSSGKVGDWSQREGAPGAFAKGILTTVLATPCSAPFLAPALTWAVAQPAAKTFAVFGAVGLGMASPYLLIGAFPGLIRFLPRPGAWMETFKHIMGFVLLATVVFITSFIQWVYIVPTVALLFGLWASCSWIGRIPATASVQVKVLNWLGAIVLSFVVWVIAFPGIDDVVSGRFAFGGLAETMKSRLRQMVDQAEDADDDGERMYWRRFTEARFKRLVDEKRTILVDFTADWCLTCKTLEGQVLNTPPVIEAVRDHCVATLKADWTHGDPEVTRMLEQLGSKQVPVIAIFPAGAPTRPEVLLGGYTQSSLIDAIKSAAGTAQPE